MAGWQDGVSFPSRDSAILQFCNSLYLHEGRVRRRQHLDACRRCCGEIAFLNELRRVVAEAEPELPADVGVRMEAFLATLEGSTDDRPDAQG